MSRPEQDRTTSDRLLDVMCSIRKALKSGNFPALVALQAEQATLSEKLSRQGGRLAAPQLVRLRQAANRNQRLLVAAQNGVRTVLSRYREKDQGPAFKTYDQRGRAREIAGAAPKLEKRR